MFLNHVFFQQTSSRLCMSLHTMLSEET